MSPRALMNAIYAEEIREPLAADIQYATSLWGEPIVVPPPPEPEPTPPPPGDPDMGGLRAIFDLLKSLSTFIGSEQFNVFVKTIREMFDAWRAQQAAPTSAHSTQIAPERQAVLDELEAEIAKLESCG